MSPALKYGLIAVSVALLTRSFYILYVQKRGTRPARILTWAAAIFVVCFWTWQLGLKHLWSED
jgi:hypothetical protein